MKIVSSATYHKYKCTHTWAATYKYTHIYTTSYTCIYKVMYVVGVYTPQSLAQSKLLFIRLFACAAAVVFGVVDVCYRDYMLWLALLCMYLWFGECIHRWLGEPILKNCLCSANSRRSWYLHTHIHICRCMCEQKYAKCIEIVACTYNRVCLSAKWYRMCEIFTSILLFGF